MFKTQKRFVSPKGYKNATKNTMSEQGTNSYQNKQD